MKKIEVEIIREHLVNAQICCNISPLAARIRRKAIEQELPSTGIRSQWKIDFSIKPVRCAEKKGFWHYILVC